MFAGELSQLLAQRLKIGVYDSNTTEGYAVILKEFKVSAFPELTKILRSTGASFLIKAEILISGGDGNTMNITIHCSSEAL